MINSHGHWIVLSSPAFSHQAGPSPIRVAGIQRPRSPQDTAYSSHSGGWRRWGVFSNDPTRTRHRRTYIDHADTPSSRLATTPRTMTLLSLNAPIGPSPRG